MTGAGIARRLLLRQLVGAPLLAPAALDVLTKGLQEAAARPDEAEPDEWDACAASDGSSMMSSAGYGAREKIARVWNEEADAMNRLQARRRDLRAGGYPPNIAAKRSWSGVFKEHVAIQDSEAEARILSTNLWGALDRMSEAEVIALAVRIGIESVSSS